jgi:enoyl-CoA hydratase
MSSDTLILARDGAVATLTFNRPAALNALNAELLAALAEAVDTLAADDAVRVLVLTGAGEKAFVAGADIKELAAQSPVSGRELARRGQALFRRLETLGKPVIAAINGFALGGGCELAMACTFRLAADSAQLGQPEVNLGLIPGYGGSQRLPRLVGKDRAMDLILTGRRINADEAFRIGLVTRVVPAAALLDEAQALARELAAKPPVAVRYAMEAIERGLDMPFDDGCDYEATLFGLVASTEDMKEGTRAFVEKRKPTFTGR